jgi:predicted RNase H-like nuclease (RuvC/YqgF family)
MMKITELVESLEEDVAKLKARAERLEAENERLRQEVEAVAYKVEQGKMHFAGDIGKALRDIVRKEW